MDGPATRLTEQIESYRYHQLEKIFIKIDAARSGSISAPRPALLWCVSALVARFPRAFRRFPARSRVALALRVSAWARAPSQSHATPLDPLSRRPPPLPFQCVPSAAPVRAPVATTAFCALACRRLPFAPCCCVDSLTPSISPRALAVPLPVPREDSRDVAPLCPLVLPRYFVRLCAAAVVLLRSGEEIVVYIDNFWSSTFFGFYFCKNLQRWRGLMDLQAVLVYPSHH